MSGRKIARSRTLAGAINCEDFRVLARRRLPRVVFDFIDGGAEGEVTLGENRRAFQEVHFRPRQASAPREIDTSVDVLGTGLRSPVMIAPCGAARVVHPEGELALARAAAAAGTIYVVPHMGGHRLEAVRAATSGPLWYQIYKMGSREVAEAAIGRAAAAGYAALVVTVDNSPTMRERDLRNGLPDLLSGSVRRALPHVGQLLVRPGWLAGFWRDGWPTGAPNAVLADGRAMTPADIMAANAQPASTFDWQDFAWIRQAWRGPMVVKGILTPEDARRALDWGSAAIIVSNHGGRALDGVGASLRALPAVAAATGGRVPVYLDGGIRRGSDVIKALCLGAQAVLIGRPSMFALACGEAGIARLLALLAADVRRTLGALGCGAVAELDRALVTFPRHWHDQ